MENFYCGAQCVVLHLLIVSKQDVNERAASISQLIKSALSISPYPTESNYSFILCKAPYFKNVKGMTGFLKWSIRRHITS